MKNRPTVLAALFAFAAAAGSATAQSPAAAPAGSPPLPKGVPAFEVAQYNSFTWYGRFGWTNCSFVDTGDGVLVVDTGWTKQDGENLKAQIREKTKGKPVRWIVLTQTDVDSNGGLEAFLPTDATVFVHARGADPLARGLLRAEPGKKAPTVVGVADQLVLSSGGRRFELHAAPGSAHSAYDLVAVSTDSGLAFVGDLVTAGRCPNLVNTASDLAGWIAMIDRIRQLHPAGLVATRGEPTRTVFQELDQTQTYLERVLGFLKEQKAKSAPEARVAAELSLKKIGDYCPASNDNANVLALYRRMQADGTFSQPKPATPKPTR
jgi:glyoxylase-like metal-dependent hydrolase (beta-lactamase superfamily II)